MKPLLLQVKETLLTKWLLHQKKLENHIIGVLTAIVKTTQNNITQKKSKTN